MVRPELPALVPVRCPVSKHLLCRLAGTATIELRCTCRRILLVRPDGTVEVVRDH